MYKEKLYLNNDAIYLGIDKDILETTIKLIADHGFERISLQLVAETAEIRLSEINERFQRVKPLLGRALDAALTSMEGHVKEHIINASSPGAGLNHIWHALTDFSQLNFCRSKVISRYLKSPHLQLLDDFKPKMIMFSSRLFSAAQHELSVCNHEIQFCAMAFLIQKANLFVYDISSSKISYHNRISQLNDIETDIYKICRLCFS